jgi:hypothetical protein
MDDLVIIITLIVCVLGLSVVMWSLRGSHRSTASLQIEQCRLNAEATVEQRRLQRLQDVVMMLTSRQAMGCKLTEQDHEELRIAHNELFHGGQP